MASNGKKLRVLIVDDSAFNRKNIADIFSSIPDTEVVGKVADGDEALRAVSSLKPDLITLDLEMPRMDGFTFLRILMARQPVPVVVISSYDQKENVFKALELGAIDFIAKPNRQVADSSEIRAEILQKIAMVRNLQPTAVLGSRPPRVETTGPLVVSASVVATESPPAAPKIVVGVASSTGGPTALLEIFGRLPARLSASLLIAQHMPDKFTRTFAERLDKRGAFRVSEAQDGDAIHAQTAFVCPGRQCMEVIGTSTSGFRLRTGAPGSSDTYVPSADRLLRSLALAFKARSVAVILTGMGDDGVAGAKAIRDVGGTVVVECEESAVVFGMPGAVVRAGLAQQALSLPEIVNFLENQAR